MNVGTGDACTRGKSHIVVLGDLNIQPINASESQHTAKHRCARLSERSNTDAVSGRVALLSLPEHTTFRAIFKHKRGPAINLSIIDGSSTGLILRWTQSQSALLVWQ